VSGFLYAPDFEEKLKGVGTFSGFRKILLEILKIKYFCIFYFLKNSIDLFIIFENNSFF